METAYDGRQVVGMDLHRRRSVLVRMTEDGRRLGTAKITNSPEELRAQIARAGQSPKVVLEATYGWYWAADTLAAAGAKGTVGPNLDQLKPDQKRVERQVTNGGAAMPAFKGRLTATQIAAVAKFVSSAAGKK